MTGREFEVYIVAVSKEDEPLADVYQISQETLDAGLEEVRTHQPRIVQLINGEVEPENVNTYSRLYRTNFRVDPENVVTL